MLESVKNNEKVQRVRTHLRENRVTYIAAGSGLVVGAIGMLFASRSNVAVINPAIMNWKPVTNTVQVSMIRPGSKSFVIQAIETQQTWPSLRAAAKDLGHNPGTLSAHLKGKVEDVNGLHLTKVAEI